MSEVPSDKGEFAPVEEEQTEAPRRAASAEFIVESEVGSQVLLREAMDPANQSLRDALRLSYRVLQIVMLVLVVVFIFSGVQQVQVGQTGVMLRWGKIVGNEGEQALNQGAAFSWFPYPAGEFILFEESSRRINLDRVFWPRIRPDRTIQEEIEGATAGRLYNPGADGLVLTHGGDIAHIQLDGEYEILDPVRFVKAVENQSADPGGFDADRLVTLALQRAVIHVAAETDMETFIAFNAEVGDNVTATAQAMLDTAETGILIDSVVPPVKPEPALAVGRVANDVQEAIRGVETAVRQAQSAADNILNSTFGDEYVVILEHIAEYESAVDRGDDAAAEVALTNINDSLENSGASVASVIQQAKSHGAFIESTFGQEARRFRGLLPAYRKNPELVIERLWAEAYRTVVGRQDVHLVMLPAGLGEFVMRMGMPDEIAQIRRDQRLNEKEAATNAQMNTGRWNWRADQVSATKQSGRQLNLDTSSGSR